MRGPGIAALLAACLAAGCRGKPIATAIEGEPVCEDFRIGVGEQLAGGLERPVQLVLRDDDGDVVVRGLIKGLRNATEGRTRVTLPDDDATYTVEWGQCENPRAPQLARLLRAGSASLAYECGEAPIYRKEQIATRARDPSSHSLRFSPPPHGACLSAPAAAEGGSVARGAVDAGAPPGEADGGGGEGTGGAAPAPAIEASAHDASP